MMRSIHDPDRGAAASGDAGIGFRSMLTMGCLALGVALGIGALVERSIVDPACAAYGRAHGLAYERMRFHAGNQDVPAETACEFRATDGEASETNFRHVAPFLVDLGVCFALDVSFVIPALVVVVWVIRRRRRR